MRAITRTMDARTPSLHHLGLLATRTFSASLSNIVSLIHARSHLGELRRLERLTDEVDERSRTRPRKFSVSVNTDFVDKCVLLPYKASHLKLHACTHGSS